MRFLVLLVIVAIVYIWYSRFSAIAPTTGEPDPAAPMEVNSSIDPALNQPLPTRPGPSRQPLDRTRAVISGIEKNRSDSEF